MVLYQEQINTGTNSIIGDLGALAALANYYQSFQITVAVVAGLAVGSGLLLAFTGSRHGFGDIMVAFELGAGLAFMLFSLSWQARP